MRYCPLNNFKECNVNCAWHHFVHGESTCAIKSLASIDTKILTPNIEEMRKTKELNEIVILNNMEVQKKTAALLDECSSYIKKEKAKAQLELERWDT